MQKQEQMLTGIYTDETDLHGFLGEPTDAETSML
jgi:hypothetical protein